MVMKRLLMVFGLLASLAQPVQAQDAQQIIRQAMDHYRGVTSYSEMTKTIQRADWTRSMTMQA